MKENIYYTELFDIYGTLLTDKQQEYFKDYFFENLLLDEISENSGVSKNAVSKEIKRSKDLLDYYEKNLSIYSKREKLLKKYKDNKDIIKIIEEYF